MDSELINNLNNPYVVNIITHVIIVYGQKFVEPFKQLIENNDTAFDTYKNYIEPKNQLFLQEINTNSPNIVISQKADKDEIIRRTIDTAQLLPRTREEKLKYLARLLQYSLSEEEYLSNDEFDDYSKILDELSVRELQILCIFNDFDEKTVKNDDENELQHSNKFWNEFFEEVKRKFNLENDTVSAMLQRLCRTGCIEAITGMNWDYEGGQYKLTPLFKELAKIAKFKSNDFDDSQASQIATSPQAAPRNDSIKN